MGRYRVSQARLAAAVGMSQTALSKRLAGKLNFTVRELGEVARFFRKSLGDIVTPMILITASAFYVTRTEDPPSTEVSVQLSLFEGTDTPALVTFAGEPDRPAIHKEAA